MIDASTLASDSLAAFTQEELDWLSWLEHLAGEPDFAMPRAGEDFTAGCDAAAGLPPAEQALCAVTAARLNGCFFCASVHGRIASRLSGREADVQRLLDCGLAAELGPRWNAVVTATAALSVTPSLFGPEHVAGLRRVGLDDAAIAELIDCAASCNEANRLTLSLGEPKSVSACGSGGSLLAQRDHSRPESGAEENQISS